MGPGRGARRGAGCRRHTAARPGRPRARLSGRLHSSTRDRAAISHHYDLSNEFYALLLDPSMAYSCGYWSRPDDPDYTPADAQYDKLELICRKVGLRAAPASSTSVAAGVRWPSTPHAPTRPRSPP